MGLLLLASLSLCALLAGCQRRQLWVDMGARQEVAITPDWTMAKETPQGCEAFIYQDGALVRRSLHSDVNEVRNELPSGDYFAVVVSYSESEYWAMSFDRVERYESFTVKSRNVEPSPSAVSAVPMLPSGGTRSDAGRIYEAEWIATGTSRPFTIQTVSDPANYIAYESYLSGEHSELRTETEYVPCTETDATKTFRLKVWADGARTVSGLTLWIHGLAAGWNIARATPIDDTGSLPVYQWKRILLEGSVGYFTSEATSFGFPRDVVPSEAEVTLIFTRSDESLYETVTKIVPIRVDDKTLEIVIGLESDPVVLPPLVGGNDSFGDAWVDSWGDEHNTDIDM